MKTLALIGASGHGKVVADLAESLGYSVHFYDDNYPDTDTVGTWSVEGSLPDLLKAENRPSFAFVAIGNNHIREAITQKLEKLGFSIPALIHPTAIISKHAKVGGATAIFAGVVVNAFAVIGKGCIINSRSVVEHDNIIEDFVHVSPGTCLAGNVTVKKYSWVGIGSSVKQGVTIGENSIVGAGAAVVSDIQDNLVVAGTPAKKLRAREC